MDDLDNTDKIKVMQLEAENADLRAEVERLSAKLKSEITKAVFTPLSGALSEWPDPASAGDPWVWHRQVESKIDGIEKTLAAIMAKVLQPTMVVMPTAEEDEAMRKELEAAMAEKDKAIADKIGSGSEAGLAIRIEQMRSVLDDQQDSFFKLKLAHETVIENHREELINHASDLDKLNEAVNALKEIRDKASVNTYSLIAKIALESIEGAPPLTEGA